MDRTVHIGAVVQISTGRYGPYVIFIPEIVDRAVHTGAAFKKLDRILFIVLEKNQMAISLAERKQSGPTGPIWFPIA